MKVTELELSRIAQALAPEERRPFVVPQIPPGVVPKGAKLALDSASTMMGWLNNQAGFCGLGFPGYTYLSELAQRSEYRSATETIAKEMTRAWGEFQGAETDRRRELEQAFIKFDVRGAFRRCAELDGFFGRGMLYIGIKGQESDGRRQIPLLYTPETIKKGSLAQLTPVEPIWTTPVSYNAIDPAAPDFYKPSVWYMLSKRVHASRLLSFIGRPLPDMLKPAYNFGGMSLSQLMEPYVNRWLKTVDSVNRLISNFATIGVKTNLQAILEGGSNEGSIINRAKLFNLMRDNRGLMLLDKDAEEFFQSNTPLSALPDLQAQAQEHMAAPTHIPLVKLTGVTPAGLNASSEGEIKVFYDFIAAEQSSLFDAHMATVLKIMQCHLWGKIDENIKFVWRPLDSPNDKELAEMHDKDAKAGDTYIQRGVVSRKEVRQRLRSDPNSGYGFLTSDEPPEKPDVPTPEGGEGPAGGKPGAGPPNDSSK